MVTIIDGFNLIYKIPEIEGFMYEGKLFDATRSLTRLLNEYARGVKEKKIDPKLRRGTKFIVAIDGKKQPGVNITHEVVKNVEIYYSQELSADHLIKELVKKSPNPKNLTVVTSDKEIILHCRAYNVKFTKSEDYSAFLRKAMEDMGQKEITRPEEDADLELTSEELKYWEKIFRE